MGKVQGRAGPIERGLKLTVAEDNVNLSVRARKERAFQMEFLPGGTARKNLLGKKKEQAQMARA